MNEKKFHLFTFLLILLFSAGVAMASTGKIAGTVVDKETGEGLPMANVMIKGTSMGAATDMEGNYVILNVPPGVYTVTASIIGFQKKSITDVRVNVDFTTRLDFELGTGDINLPAVIVQGERNPLIRQDLTNPTVAITGETIEELPVDNITDVIKLQAGVVVGNDGQLHFRGGEGNEVAFTLNGVSLNDPYGNRSSIGLATNAVQEVSVSTGTFSAEYGNALSGVVNYVTKEGGSKYTGSLRSYAGDYISNRDQIFPHIDDLDPLNRSRIEGTFGGPVPLFGDDLKFFFSGVYSNRKGYIYGERLYNNTDSYITRAQFPSDHSLRASSLEPYFFNPFGDTTGLPTGDGEVVPLSTGWDLNLQANLSYKITPTLKLKYEVVMDKGEFDGGGSIGTLEAKYAPDTRGRTYSDALHNAVEFTHTVSQNMFYTVKASYTKNNGEYYLYEDIDDPRYLPSLYQRAFPNMTFLTGGTDNLRFFRETTTKGIKLDMVAQLWGAHEVKFGMEGRFFELEVESYNIEIGKVDSSAEGNFGSLTVDDLLNPSTQIIRRVPTSPSLYTHYTRKPSSFAAYLRDKIELAKSLILNFGLRYEYFNPTASYNPMISSELQTYKEGEITRNLATADVKHMLSPRFSVSYPITDQGIIRFSYGHFYQNGSLSSLYRNPTFYVTNVGSTPSFGNPNVDPQKSVQYEMGLLQGLTEDLRLEFTGYYKDVTDYIYTQTIYTTSGRQFSLLTNLAYSNVKGITLSLFKRRGQNSMFQGSLDYTFQIAEGNRTQPSDELFYSESSGKQTETYLVPLSFDRQHVINATFNLVQPQDWTLGLVAFFQTGTPYTPSFPSELVPITFEQNSTNRPIQWNVDLKFEKFFEIGSLKYSLFLHVNNLFDTEREVYVYASSGRAGFSVEETTNAGQFDDIRSRINRGDPGMFPIDQVNDYYSQRPGNYGSPREVRLGFSVIFN